MLIWNEAVRIHGIRVMKHVAFAEYTESCKVFARYAPSIFMEYMEWNLMLTQNMWNRTVHLLKMHGIKLCIFKECVNIP
jgi:hypothetical protein